ncbi:hypothetical protein Fmac_004407 [Flemingia macrophylla]|uniref:Uncharacterized protein n=1 Tax=Flemingia macrophylla TaxID=520843 RepID=A0ABD1N4U2_9FABA
MAGAGNSNCQVEKSLVVLVIQRYSVQGEVEVERMHLALLGRETLLNYSMANSSSKRTMSSIDVDVVKIPPSMNDSPKPKCRKRHIP